MPANPCLQGKGFDRVRDAAGALSLTRGLKQLLTSGAVKGGESASSFAALGFQRGKSLKLDFSLLSEGISPRAPSSLLGAKRAELPFETHAINPVTTHFGKH